MSDHDDIAALPPLLAQIAEATSLKTALQLVVAWGGTRVYVPRRPAFDSELSKVVGLRAARAIARLYGGERLEVPNLARGTGRYADELRRTKRLVNEGLNTGEIARKLKITRRAVFYRRKAIVTDDAPLPLFEHTDKRSRG